MPDRDDAFYRRQTEALFDRLLAAGWIERSGFHDPSLRYAFKWTDKGQERAQLVKSVATELQLGPKGLAALLSICELHADHPGPDAGGVAPR